MATAIIGVGNIGKAVATHLTDGGETVVLAADNEANAQQLAKDLGRAASAASVADAIDRADAVIFAVWLDVIKQLVAEHGARLVGKVVVDPSNPITVAPDGTFPRTLPDGVSSASVIDGLLPTGAHFVKAQSRGFDRVERFLLQLSRRRSFSWTGKRAAGHRAMVGALGLLEHVEGSGVLVLPLEPAQDAIDGGVLVRRRALDAEAVAGVGLLGVRRPLGVAARRHDPVTPPADDRFRHRALAW